MSLEELATAVYTMDDSLCSVELVRSIFSNVGEMGAGGVCGLVVYSLHRPHCRLIALFSIQRATDEELETIKNHLREQKTRGLAAGAEGFVPLAKPDAFLLALSEIDHFAQVCLVLDVTANTCRMPASQHQCVTTPPHPTPTAR